MKIFKGFAEKGYKHHVETIIQQLDNMSLNDPDIITEFAHLREWLRVNHDIWISCYPTSNLLKYQIRIYQKNKSLINKIYGDVMGHHFNSPQEAYLATFDYILNNLI
jgi:hypothetical protein